MELVKHLATRAWSSRKNFRTIKDMRESWSFWTSMGSYDRDRKQRGFKASCSGVREIVKVQQNPEKWIVLQENVQENEEGFKKEVINCVKCYPIKEDDGLRMNHQ